MKPPIFRGGNPLLSPDILHHLKKNTTGHFRMFEVNWNHWIHWSHWMST